MAAMSPAALDERLRGRRRWPGSPRGRSPTRSLRAELAEQHELGLRARRRGDDAGRDLPVHRRAGVPHRQRAVRHQRDDVARQLGRPCAPRCWTSCARGWPSATRCSSLRAAVGRVRRSAAQVDQRSDITFATLPGIANRLARRPSWWTGSSSSEPSASARAVGAGAMAVSDRTRLRRPTAGHGPAGKQAVRRDPGAGPGGPGRPAGFGAGAAGPERRREVDAHQGARRRLHTGQRRGRRRRSAAGLGRGRRPDLVHPPGPRPGARAVGGRERRARHRLPAPVAG